MKKLAIIGASGHGKVIADIAKKNGYKDIVFLDDNESVAECGGYPVVGTAKTVGSLGREVIVAIGNAAIRRRMMAMLREEQIEIVTLIHPAAIIGENVRIGAGTVVMAGAVINPGAAIGEGCIINTCASVDHDCVLENYVHISVGAHLAGTVTVGESTWIGAGAIVNNNLAITGECMIGSGTVVVRDIKEAGTYVGVPAKKIR